MTRRTCSLRNRRSRVTTNIHLRACRKRRRIECIEKLCPELHTFGFGQRRFLNDRDIEVALIWTADNPVQAVTERPAQAVTPNNRRQGETRSVDKVVSLLVTAPGVSPLLLVQADPTTGLPTWQANPTGAQITSPSVAPRVIQLALKLYF
jgi:hypothetical protein